jgi:nucleoside-diphosphate-sugar epimerase
MIVLVTGGLGFIGSHLVDALVEDKRVDRVIIVDNLSSGLMSNIEHHSRKDVLLLKYDIAAEHAVDILEETMKELKVDLVFHLAAAAGVPVSIKKPMNSYRNNDFSTINVLEAARRSGVKRVVSSSSSSIYGGNKPFPTVEADSAYQDFDPRSPYAQYKAVGEQFCKMYTNVYGLDTACLRYFNIFGPRQRADSAYAAVIAAFIDSAEHNKTPIIHGDGTQFRDFTYVANAVHANMLAAFHHKPIGGESFNVGTGSRISVNDIHKASGALNAKYVEAREGDVYGSQASIDKISRVLGYKVIIDFEDGMELTKAWHKREV